MPIDNATGVFKLLLVDDDPSTLKLLNTTFEPDNRLDGSVARDGDEAMRIYRTLHPDLVILDIALPGRNGYSVCRLIKHDPVNPGTAVVLLSGQPQQDARESAWKVGADGFVPKPFSPKDLLEVVGARVDKHLAALARR
jgi:CheY-like chemotaxis protein